MLCSTAISLDGRKLVHVHCCCDLGNGVIIVVRDPDSTRVESATPLAPENLAAGRGRGIRLKTLAIDEVQFERKRTEVHLQSSGA